jgi:hypothetical protein
MDRCAAILAVAASLAGCGLSQRLAEQRNAEDDAKCLSYGARRGDPAYVQCRAQLDAARTQASAIESAAPPRPDFDVQVRANFPPPR